MKIAISTESSADCTKALAQLHQIAIIPFTVNKGLTSIKDGDETLEQLFAYVEETGKLPKTSAINTYEFQNHFGNLLKEHDAVVHISMSHACSSAYQNACVASEEFHGKVLVVDSLVFHTGQLLLVLYAAALRNQIKLLGGGVVL